MPTTVYNYLEAKYVCIFFRAFINMINTPTESLKVIKMFIFQHFSFHEQLKFHAQLN